MNVKEIFNTGTEAYYKVTEDYSDTVEKWKNKDMPNILVIKNRDGVEIVKITPEGNIYWKGRLVETDQEYRDTMMYVGKRLAGMIYE